MMRTSAAAGRDIITHRDTRESIPLRPAIRSMALDDRARCLQAFRVPRVLSIF